MPSQMCLGTMGMAPAPPNCRNVATGALSRNSTVRGPAAMTSAMSETGSTMICWESFPAARWAAKYWKVKTTSSGVSGRPSCHRRLSRSSKVWVRPSSDWRKLAASHGSTAPVESFHSRVS